MEINNATVTENKASKDKESIMQRNARYAFALIIGLFGVLSPETAFAAPWDDMADEVIDLLTNGFTRSLAIIVCIGLGLAAWAGKLTWGMAGRFVAGIVLIFGAAAFVDVFIDAV